jgi:hypothetical protein
MKMMWVFLSVLLVSAGECFSGPVRPVESDYFSTTALSGPVWDPLAQRGQWFLAPGADTYMAKSWEFHDDDAPLSIKGVVQSIFYDPTPSSNILMFSVLATVSNNLPSGLALNAASNSHNEIQNSAQLAYSGPMLGTRIVAEFAVADMTLLPSGVPPYYTDPVSAGMYFIEAVNEDEWAWYCWSPEDPEKPQGNFQVPSWALGDIPPGASTSVVMQFQVMPQPMPISDYRHSVIRYSKDTGADIFYNRHTSLKISHWLDTLLVDYTNIISAPPGSYEPPEPPEYIYASDVSVFFDPELDFGDAPDPFYPTLLANDGARHILQSGLFLGALIDAEPDGQPGQQALDDDTNNLADEDGVSFAGNLVRGSNMQFNVVASGSGNLNAWIDFNQDGIWSGPDEQIAADLALVMGTNHVGVLIPSNAIPGETYGRFRFSSSTGLQPLGVADDGEVEDYAFTVYQTAPSGNITITNVVYNAAAEKITIEWNGQAPLLYRTYYADSLTGGVSWTCWGGDVSAAPYRQTNAVDPITSRYYRVSVPYAAP